MKKWLTVFIFIAIAVLSAGLRLYKVSAPVADWHSFRQADTASVAQLYAKNGIQIFIPKYHDLSNIQSGKDNLSGYRMVEFPLYQAIAAYIKIHVGFFSIEIWLRLLNIFASTATAILLGVWVAHRVSRSAGICTALSYAVLPYSMFYGRVILPDPFMVFLAICSLVILDGFGRGIERISIGRMVIASALSAAAILVKPYAGFLLLPILPIVFSKNNTFVIKVLYLCIFAAISVIPFLLWRKWILQFPEGIPVSEWLLNGNGIRFKGAWFQWLFAERIGKLILGYWGLIPFGIGLMVQRGKKESYLFVSLLLGSLLYMIIFASGNVQHDYYQIVLLPVICIYLGIGFAWLFQRVRGQGTSSSSSKFIKEQAEGSVRFGLNPVATAGVIIVSFLFMEMFGWYTIRSFYWVNRPEIIEAGKAADALLPPDAKVIAPYMGDTTFLYQTNRIGWPINFEIEKKRAMGAQYYVTVSPSDTDLETRDLARDYTVLVRNDRYAIIDLTKPKQEAGEK